MIMIFCFRFLPDFSQASIVDTGSALKVPTLVAQYTSQEVKPSEPGPKPSTTYDIRSRTKSEL
jgi:hypothetical protein